MSDRVFRDVEVPKIWTVWLDKNAPSYNVVVAGKYGSESLDPEIWTLEGDEIDVNMLVDALSALVDKKRPW